MGRRELGGQKFMPSTSEMLASCGHPGQSQKTQTSRWLIRSPRKNVGDCAEAMPVIIANVSSVNSEKRRINSSKEEATLTPGMSIS